MIIYLWIINMNINPNVMKYVQIKHLIIIITECQKGYYNDTDDSSIKKCKCELEIVSYVQ